MPRHFEEPLQEINNPFAICSAEIDRKKEPAKWERCVQKVKRRLGMSDVVETFAEDFPGGGYVADFDGQFWTIRDVPFFSELPAGTRSNRRTIERDWMEATIRRHQELENEQQHLPPVHANHHDSGRDNFRLGFLRPTRVGRLQLDGKLKWALFGDIIRVEDDHYQQIKELGYPYRSAEISTDWRPEIASLALSEDEAPHFKLPMLTIGEERRPFQQEFLPGNRPAVAFSEAGKSSYICFSFRGTTMAIAKTVDKLQEEEEKKDGEQMQEGADEAVSKVQAIIDKFVKDLPAMIEEFLKGLRPPTIRTEEGEEAVEPTILNQKMVSLEGKVDGLVEQIRQQGEDRKADQLAAESIKSLRDEGWHLTDEVEKKIHALSAKRESLEGYIEAFRSTIPKDPPKTLEEIEVFTNDAPELAKYKIQSPEVFEAACNLSAQFDQLKNEGVTLTSTREEFIDINLDVA